MDRRLDDLVREISKLSRDIGVVDGVSRQFLEFEHTQGEFRINGNQAGLIDFARVVLQVAAKNVVHAHEHLDEVNGIDRVDLPVVICLKAAE